MVWAQRDATAAPAVLARLSAHADTVLAAGPGRRHTELPSTVSRAENLPVALALTRTAAMPAPH